MPFSSRSKSSTRKKKMRMEVALAVASSHEHIPRTLDIVEGVVCYPALKLFDGSCAPLFFIRPATNVPIAFWRSQNTQNAPKCPLCCNGFVCSGSGRCGWVTTQKDSSSKSIGCSNKYPGKSPNASGARVNINASKFRRATSGGGTTAAFLWCERDARLCAHWNGKVLFRIQGPDSYKAIRNGRAYCSADARVYNACVAFFTLKRARLAGHFVANISAKAFAACAVGHPADLSADKILAPRGSSSTHLQPQESAAPPCTAPRAGTGTCGERRSRARTAHRMRGLLKKHASTCTA
eukprot:6181941-Pleurochrysis_carterae.AAC.2